MVKKSKDKKYMLKLDWSDKKLTLADLSPLIEQIEANSTELESISFNLSSLAQPRHEDIEFLKREGVDYYRLIWNFKSSSKSLDDLSYDTFGLKFYVFHLLMAIKQTRRLKVLELNGLEPEINIMLILKLLSSLVALESFTFNKITITGQANIQELANRYKDILLCKKPGFSNIQLPILLLRAELLA